MQVVLIIVGAVLVGLAIRAGWVAAKKRREALGALAGSLGWSFDASRDDRHDDQYAHFEIFRIGHSRVAYNTLSGEMEVNGESWPAKAGDFQYQVTTSNGKTTTTATHRFSYLIIHLPFAGLPDLLIRREGIFDKLAGVFGFDDIDFESEEFSRRFFVKSPDKRFAYAVIHPQMMEFLLAARPPAVDIERGRCCISDGSSLWKPEEYRANMDMLRKFLELWPEHLVADLESR